MPLNADRAMVTVDPGVRASTADVAALQPRAVAANIDLLYVVPDGAAAYVPAATTTSARSPAGHRHRSPARARCSSASPRRSA